MEDFLQHIRDDHHSFDKGTLSDHIGSDPIAFFKTWFQEVIEKNIIEPHAMHISTVDANAIPTSRVVFLKEIIDEQFIFYTNYLSKKGNDMLQNDNVSALFFWPTLERQIRIEGKVSKVSESLSDAYFESRPRSSKLGAWASQQSEKLVNRHELEERVLEYAKLYPDFVPRPPHWGGYAIKPTRLEFWQGRPSRLHDRMIFEKNNENTWDVFRLNP